MDLNKHNDIEQYLEDFAEKGGAVSRDVDGTMYFQREDGVDMLCLEDDRSEFDRGADPALDQKNYDIAEEYLTQGELQINDSPDFEALRDDARQTMTMERAEQFADMDHEEGLSQEFSLAD
ncbi:MAG: hypothetical protein VX730_07555 [Pseudomonadota bacterium]|nr:hypothetical protein [Pseudomonadota bacterium]